MIHGGSSRKTNGVTLCAVRARPAGLQQLQKDTVAAAPDSPDKNGLP